MTEPERTAPKVCAVCGIVLDRAPNPLGPAAPEQWIHTAELFGKSDHMAVPVDYAAVPVRTMCDFCYDEVPASKLWVVEARDFKAPVIGTMSIGGWAACETDAQLVAARDWTAVQERYFTKRPEMANPTTRAWLPLMHAELEKHMVGEPRPWRAGDEKAFHD